MWLLVKNLPTRASISRGNSALHSRVRTYCYHVKCIDSSDSSILAISMTVLIQFKVLPTEIKISGTENCE